MKKLKIIIYVKKIFVSLILATPTYVNHLCKLATSTIYNNSDQAETTSSSPITEIYVYPPEYKTQKGRVG